jgi:hypothetical protein
MDVATKLLSETVNRTPTVIEREITHVRELLDERIKSSDTGASERFASIALQFKERDERSSQLAKTQDEALKAALQSAEKLNDAQGAANKEANIKTEITFGQQLKAVEDKVDVINRRLDTGQGTLDGAARQRTQARDTKEDSRQGSSLLIYAILGMVSVATFILYVIKK